MRAEQVSIAQRWRRRRIELKSFGYMGSMRAERRSHNAMQAAEKGSKNLFTILLRTRDTGSGGARNPHIYQICSGSCAPSFPVCRALVTDRKQVQKHLLFKKGHDRIRRNNEMVQQSNIK